MGPDGKRPAPSDDLWVRNAHLLFCDEEVEKRVRAKAAHLASKCRRLRNSGFDVPLLEVDDFIAHAWLLALKSRPDFPDRTGMILYFWRRMENLFKDKCRKSAGARFRGISMKSDADEFEAKITVFSLEKYREDHRDSDDADALEDFKAYLSLHDPALLPLLTLIFEDQVDNARDQAQKLSLEVKDIYRLRARLSLQARRMRGQSSPEKISRVVRLPRLSTARVSYSPTFRMFSGHPPEGAGATGRVDEAIFAHPAMSIPKAVAFFRGKKPER